MTVSCDCELSHNGFGMVGRECDCPAGRPILDAVWSDQFRRGFIPNGPILITDPWPSISITLHEPHVSTDAGGPHDG